jgi:hypothetical protein
MIMVMILKKKKIILAALVLCALLLFSAFSCSSGDNGNGNGGGRVIEWDGETSLDNILASFRALGMDSFWDILAVYNAGHNPFDGNYGNYDGILDALEAGETAYERAWYVIVTNLSVAIGADPEYFEEYENFKNILRGVVENPGDGPFLWYVRSYLALKTAGERFNETPFREYLESRQLPDGGFGTAGAGTGDVFYTAAAIPAIILMFHDYLDPALNLFITGHPGDEMHFRASAFIQNSIDRDGGGTAEGNAVATALALSSMMADNTVLMSGDGELIRIAREGLSLFEAGGGYSFEIGGGRDAESTAFGALALGDLRNAEAGRGEYNVWIKLYREWQLIFGDY